MWQLLRADARNRVALQRALAQFFHFLFSCFESTSCLAIWVGDRVVVTVVKGRILLGIILIMMHTIKVKIERVVWLALIAVAAPLVSVADVQSAALFC